MKINQDKELKEVKVELDGAKNLTKKVLVGPEHGSNNIVMRYFRILPQGHTPYHKHNYEHVVKVQKGKGIAVDAQGKEHELSPGQSIFIAPNEEHQVKNPFAEPFELICIIPNIEQNEQKM